MFRSCRNRFRCFSQMKITNLDLFRITLKIILVGTGNVLSPHKYFQFDRTLKNVVVNSESAFWDISKRLLEGLGGQGSPSWGGQGVAGQGWSSSMELHMAHLFLLMV